MVKLSNGEYLSTTMMPTKGIFYNWTIRHICEDYRLATKLTYSNKGSIPYLKKSLMPLGKPWCSTLWIYIMTTINCHWMKITISITHWLEYFKVGSYPTELDDDRQKFMMAYTNQFNTKTKWKCFIIVWVISSLS